MLSNAHLKLLTALQVKKYRQKYRKFVVEGEKMVGELLAQRRLPVEAVFGLESWAADHAGELRPWADRFQAVTEAELKKISTLTTPNRALAVAGFPPDEPDPARLPTRFCFYLDGLQDPGNLGTILRTADWFGHPALFCSPDTVDVYSPKVIQAAMGAFLRVPTREIALDELLSGLPDWPVLGAVLGGDDLFTAPLPPFGLLVIGNEGRGIRPETAARLTHRLSIPRGAEGGAESLNAAVAAGIFAAWAYRQL
jgi:TrmH family RNA methyltransferase